MVVRYSGELVVRIRIRPDLNWCYEATVKVKGSRGLLEKYNCSVVLPPANRTRSEDDPINFDEVARVAISYSDAVGLMDRCEIEVYGKADRICVRRSAR